MKLLKGRKLLSRPKQIESKRGKIISRTQYFWSKISKHKMLFFNLLVILATVIFAIFYYIDKQEIKEQEQIEQQKIEEEGQRLRNLFFSSVYEEEVEVLEEQEQAEERRKESISSATEEPTQPEGEESEGEEAETEPEEISEREQVIIDTTEALEQIDKGSAEEFPTYQNAAHKYSIQYLPNWFLDKLTNRTAWLAYITSYDPTGKDRGDFPQSPRMEILVQANVRNLSLDDWMQEGYKYHGDPESSAKIKVQDIDAYKNIEINPYAARVVTLIHNNLIYTFTYTGGDISADENKKIFDFMINSIRFQ